MTFEMKHIDDVVRIALAGGGFTMAGNLKSTDDLVRIALAAGQGNARVSFTGISQLRHIDDIVRIALAGKGSISFAD